VLSKVASNRRSDLQIGFGFMTARVAVKMVVKKTTSYDDVSPANAKSASGWFCVGSKEDKETN
jgi:hypothetical protein